MVVVLLRFFLFKIPVEFLFTRFLGREHGPFLHDRVTAISLIRHVLVELGPIFIKLGQILGQEVMIPPRIRDDLMKIVDDVPPFGFKEARRIIEAEFQGKTLEELFSEFDEKPDHAASLCEMHRAVLRYEGYEVAVKVQRPYINGVAKLDLTILDILIKIGPFVWSDLFKMVELKTILKAFTDTLWDELDFQLEGRNQERWANKIAETEMYRDYVKVARVYWPYTTMKVLTQEYVRDFVKWGTKRGLELSALSKVDGTPWQGHTIPMLMCLFNGVQLIDWNFFHGDMHKGNWYMWEDPDDGRIKLFVCDFGMRGDVAPDACSIIMRLVGGAMVGINDDEIEQLIFDLHEGGGGRREDLPPGVARTLGKRLLGKISGEVIPESGLRTMRATPMGMRGTVSMDTFGAALAGGIGPMGFKLPEWIFLWGKLCTYCSCLAQESCPGWDGGTSVYTPMILNATKKNILEEIEDANVVNFNRRVDMVMRKNLIGDLYGMWKVFSRTASLGTSPGTDSKT